MKTWMPTLILAAMLSACGGGNSTNSNNTDKSAASESSGQWGLSNWDESTWN